MRGEEKQTSDCLSSSVWCSQPRTFVQLTWSLQFVSREEKDNKIAQQNQIQWDMEWRNKKVCQAIGSAGWLDFSWWRRAISLRKVDGSWSSLLMAVPDQDGRSSLPRGVEEHARYHWTGDRENTSVWRRVVVFCRTEFVQPRNIRFRQRKSWPIAFL